MTANRSQYMILNADNNDNNMTIQQQGQQERNIAFEQLTLPCICSTFSPSCQELEEIAQEQYPHNMTCGLRGRVQAMQ